MHSLKKNKIYLMGGLIFALIVGSFFLTRFSYAGFLFPDFSSPSIDVRGTAGKIPDYFNIPLQTTIEQNQIPSSRGAVLNRQLNLQSIPQEVIENILKSHDPLFLGGIYNYFPEVLTFDQLKGNDIDTWEKLNKFLIQNNVTDQPEDKINAFVDRIKRENLEFYQKNNLSLSNLNNDIVQEIKNRIFLKEGIETYLNNLGIRIKPDELAQKDMVISAFSHLLPRGVLPRLDSIELNELLALLKGAEMVRFSQLLGMKSPEHFKDLGKIKLLSVSDLYYQLQEFFRGNNLPGLDLNTWNQLAEKYSRALLENNLAKIGAISFTRKLTFKEFPPGTVSPGYDQGIVREGDYQLYVWSAASKLVDLSELNKLRFRMSIKLDSQQKPTDAFSVFGIQFITPDIDPKAPGKLITSEAKIELKSEVEADEEGFYNYDIEINRENLSSWDAVKEKIRIISLFFETTSKIPEETYAHLSFKDFEFTLKPQAFLDPKLSGEFLKVAALKNWDFSKSGDRNLMQLLLDLDMKDIYGTNFLEKLPQVGAFFKSIFGRTYFPEYWNLKDLSVLFYMADRFREGDLKTFVDNLRVDLDKRSKNIKFIEDNLLNAEINSRRPVTDEIYKYLGTQTDLDKINAALGGRILKVANLTREVLAKLKGDYPDKGGIIDILLNNLSLNPDDLGGSLRESLLDNYLKYASYLDRNASEVRAKINEFWTELFKRGLAKDEGDILKNITELLSSRIMESRDISANYKASLTPVLLNEILAYLNLKEVGKEELLSLLRRNKIFNELNVLKQTQKVSTILPPRKENIVIDTGNLVKIDTDRLQSEMQRLASELPEEAQYISQEALNLFIEGYLERNLEFKNSMDFLMVESMKKLNETKGFGYVVSTLANMGTHKLNNLGKIDFLKNNLPGITRTRSDYKDWDWYWLEVVGGTPLDKIVDLALASGDYENTLERTLHDSSLIDLHNPRDRPFLGYFTGYLNNRGFSKDEIMNFITGKDRYLPYNSYLFGQPVNGFNAVTYAGKTSFDYEAEGNPFSPQEIKNMLILSPVAKELLQQLVSVPAVGSPSVSGSEWFGAQLEKLTKYFLFTLDRKNHMVADSLGGVDDTFAGLTFLMPALISGVENSLISSDKADELVSKIMEFLEDNPWDPNDPALPEKFDLYPHYIQANSDKKSGDEWSLIDSTMPYTVLSGYYAFTKNPVLKEKIRPFFEKKNFGNLLAKRGGGAAGNDFGKLQGDPGLNFGWTPERGHTKQGADFYNEYIISYLMALGVPNSKVIPDDFYRSIKRFTKKNLLNNDGYVVTFENAMFQYQYPQTLLPFLFLKDIGFNQGEDENSPVLSQGLNHYRNAIKAIENYQSAALIYAPLFNYNYHLWSMGGSAAIPEYYSMTLGVKPGGREGENQDGTLSPSAAAGSLILSPYRAYQSLRYMELAFPELSGEFGFKDSVNPFRNYAAPTYFALGKGLELASIMNAQNFGIRGKKSLWELNLENEIVLRGLFKLGFKEDISPQFYQAFSLLEKGNISPQKAIAAVITEVDKDQLEKWLKANAPSLAAELKSRWDNELSPQRADFGGGLSQVNQDLQAISVGISQGADLSGIKDKFFNILDRAKTFADYNYLNNWLKNSLKFKDVTYLMLGGKVGAGVRPTREYPVTADVIDPDMKSNYTVFPLLYHTIIAQTKRSLDFEEREKKFKGNISSLAGNKISLAEAYLNELKEISQLAQAPDERSIFAFQHYLSKEKDYLAKAVENLETVLTTKLELMDKVKAETLLFAAYRLGWMYEKQEGQFRALSDIFKKEVPSANQKEALGLISGILLNYFEEELTGLLESGRGINKDAGSLNADTLRFKAYWAKQEEKGDLDLRRGEIQKYLAAIIEKPEDTNLNQFSVIAHRENIQSSPVQFNILNPVEAGVIGGYVSKLAYQGLSPEQIMAELATMIKIKPIVEAALGKKLDLFNSEEDMGLLAFAGSLKDKNYDNNAIARLIGGEANRIAGVAEGSVSPSTLNKITETRKLLEITNGNKGLPNLTALFNKKLNLGVSKWTDTASDLLATQEIQSTISDKLILELHKIEILPRDFLERLNNESLSVLKSDNTGLFKYKTGLKPNLDLLDASVLKYLGPIYAVYQRGQNLGVISSPDKLSSQEATLLKTWSALAQATGLNFDNAQVSFKKLYDIVSGNSELAKIKTIDVITFLASTFLPTLANNYLKNNNVVKDDNRDALVYAVNNYIDEIMKVKKELGLDLGSIDDLATAERYLKLTNAGLISRDNISQHQAQILSNPALENLRKEFKFAEKTWAGVIVPSLEMAWGKTLTDAGQEYAEQIKEILNLVSWDGQSEFILNYVNFKNKADISGNLVKVFNEIGNELPKFLEKYILGREYRPQTDAALYQKWAGEIIPRVIENLHKAVSIKEEGELLYMLGRAVEANKVRFAPPTTQDVVEREAIIPAVNWLYGEDALKKVFRVASSEKLTQNNMGYRSLLAFYADQPEPVSITSLLLAIQHELIKDGLEKVYGRAFDLLTNTEDIGAVGYYTTEVKKQAGTGLFEDIAGSLLAQGKNITNYLQNEFSRALIQIVTEQKNSLEELEKMLVQDLEIAPEDARKAALKWQEYVRRVRVEMGFTGGPITLFNAAKVVNEIILRIQRPLPEIDNLKVILDKPNQEALTSYLERNFALSKEGSAVARHIAELLLSDYSNLSSLERFKLIYEMISLQKAKPLVLKKVSKT